MKNIALSFDQLLLQGQIFFEALASELSALNIKTAHLQCDHLCFRVETEAEYYEYRALLSREATLLTEAAVNGRPICTFQLQTPLKTASQQIALIELPSPKPGTSYVTGFEHAEFVIQETFQEFAQLYPHCSFRVAGCKILNPELCLRISAGQVKFHHHSLKRIIEIEESRFSDIVFDFDGTLIDSRQQIYEVNRRVFSEVLGREVTLKESVEKFHSDFPSLFASFELKDPIQQNRALERWSDIAVEFQYELFAGTLEMLQALKAAGFRLHLWTARDAASARKILLKLKLEKFFDTFSFANKQTSKPAPESFVLYPGDYAPEKTLLIGDSENDILGARNLQATAAVALWEKECQEAALTRAGAELFFHSPQDFTAWLCQRTTANGH